MRIFQQGHFLGGIVALLCLLIFVGCGTNANDIPSANPSQTCFGEQGPVPGPVSFHATPGQSG